MNRSWSPGVGLMVIAVVAMVGPVAMAFPPSNAWATFYQDTLWDELGTSGWQLEISSPGCDSGGVQELDGQYDDNLSWIDLSDFAAGCKILLYDGHQGTGDSVICQTDGGQDCLIGFNDRASSYRMFLNDGPFDSNSASYNAGQGSFVACPGDVPTDPASASAGGACFPLSGTKTTFQAFVHDDTFSSNVAGAWSLQDLEGARADGVFCDATGIVHIDAALPGATTLRVWVGAYPQIKGAGCGLPNSGAATTGTIAVGYT